MNSCILNWSRGKETSAPWEMPKRAGLGSVIFPKNALTPMEAGWAWGGHEFPFENQVCFIINEVGDIKSKPAPLLTKLTSAPQVLIKFQPSSLSITVCSEHISHNAITHKDPSAVTSRAIFNDKIGSLQASKEFNIMLLECKKNYVHLPGDKQPYVLEMHLMGDSILHGLHLSYCFWLIQLTCSKTGWFTEDLQT